MTSAVFPPSLKWRFARSPVLLLLSALALYSDLSYGQVSVQPANDPTSVRLIFLSEKGFTRDFVEAARNVGPSDFERFVQSLEKKGTFLVETVAKVLLYLVNCLDVDNALLERTATALEGKLQDPELANADRVRSALNLALHHVRLRQDWKAGRNLHPLCAPLLLKQGTLIEQEMRILIETYPAATIRQDDERPDVIEWLAHFDASGAEGTKVLLRWLDIKPDFSHRIVPLLIIALDRFPLEPELKNTLIRKLADLWVEPNTRSLVSQQELKVIVREGDAATLDRLAPLLNELYSRTGDSAVKSIIAHLETRRESLWNATGRPPHEENKRIWNALWAQTPRDEWTMPRLKKRLRSYEYEFIVASMYRSARSNGGRYHALASFDEIVEVIHCCRQIGALKTAAALEWGRDQLAALQVPELRKRDPRKALAVENSFKEQFETVEQESDKDIDQLLYAHYTKGAGGK